jgi:hypothetical protein
MRKLVAYHYLVFFIALTISFASLANDNNCRQAPAGLCVVYLNTDNSYVNVWFDDEIMVDILVVGYDVSSWRSWFLIRTRRASFYSFQIANLADYDDSQNESVWFTAYRSHGAECWYRAERVYFYDRWDGADRLVVLNDYPNSGAYHIDVDMMVSRVNEKSPFIDYDGQSITFCEEAFH